MSRWLARIAVLALLISVAFMVLETKRMAKQVGEAELAARAARQMAAAAAADLASAQQGIRAAVPQPPTGPQANGPQPISPTLSGVDLQDYTRLQLDLHTTQQQLAVVTRLLEQRNDEQDDERRGESSTAWSGIETQHAKQFTSYLRWDGAGWGSWLLGYTVCFLLVRLLGGRNKRLLPCGLSATLLYPPGNKTQSLRIDP